MAPYPFLTSQFLRVSSTHNFVTDRLEHFLGVKRNVVVPLDYHERKQDLVNQLWHMFHIQGIFTNEINFYFASHLRIQIFVTFDCYYLFIKNKVVIQKIVKFISSPRKKKCLAAMTILVSKWKGKTNFKNLFHSHSRTLFWINIDPCFLCPNWFLEITKNRNICN